MLQARVVHVGLWYLEWGKGLVDLSEELGACSSHFWNTGLPAAFKKRKQISDFLL